MGISLPPEGALPSEGDWSTLSSDEATILKGILRRDLTTKHVAAALRIENSSAVRRPVYRLLLRAGMKTPTDLFVALNELMAQSKHRNTLTLEEAVVGLRNWARTGSAAMASQPLVVEDDADHANLKPDPSTMRSMADLRQGLRGYWYWATGGDIGAPRIADNSRGAFKRSTALKLIKADPTVPLKLEYVTGMIAGCGGSAEDQRSWASAYRRIKRANRGRHHLQVAG